MQSKELREKFLEFFQKRGHTIVPSSSLLPTDPSVLLTTAGMQQFKPYFIGKADPIKDFGSKNTVSIQKSFRTSDIDEVGDERHLTFFEMMGNFSFGGYFKKEAIQYGYDFIVKEIGLKIDYVSVFGGDANVPADEESEKIWKSIDSALVVKKFGRADNFWGPTGEEGPCGPCTEIYVDGIEIWNIVFNQYFQHKDKTLEPLKTPGVDTGMGLERLAMVSQKKENIFETDLFSALTESIGSVDEKVKRIFADHMRASVFLISDGVRPSNKEAGYILRRLLRRVLAHQILYKIQKNLFVIAYEAVKKEFGDFYPKVNDGNILEVMETERNKYQQAIDVGVRVINSLVYDDFKELGRKLFNTYQELGINFELALELLRRNGVEINEKEESEVRGFFEENLRRHQEISRAGREKKFGGHGLLLDTGELKAANEEEVIIVTKLHTATHLLQAALRKVLSDSVHQAGSDITAERTRFDFTFERKLTPEEIQKVEDCVNEAIKKDLSMGFEQIPFQKAIESGALYSPKEKYPEIVKVYTAQDSKTKEVFSKELCGGPHVIHMGEVGKFKILKEEAVGAGIRRIRAIVEK